jgi:type VI secretion system protein ImpA
MSLLDLEAMLAEVSPDAPCGPELEYSPEYVELARLVEGAPDVQYGKMHLAAVEPDWKAVKTRSSELFSQSHDLRLAVWLTRALQALSGFAGLDAGLALIEGMLTRHWEHLHPQLDSDDDNDPTARINILVALDDQSGLVRQVHTAPLVPSSIQQAFSLRDLDIAAGEWAPPNNATPVDAAEIEAAFAACPFDELSATHATLAMACERMGKIDARLTECAGRSHAISLNLLHQLLRRAAAAVQERLARHPGRPVVVSEANETGSAAPAAAPDEIVNRVDVVRMLDRLCAYYEQNEPASPVPLFLQRARRLVNLSFIEIVSDLSPAGLGEVKHIAGIESQ